ncbi:unnamed protein product [Acanthosepion pharaonis]|uniref:Uncharacterized protein n=1 Tax=Acanthosepion pharaonis TaxID=158019 RepID=A0A812CN00_ACAPH|nr:unnamed protein product [Sepia pharaonis]
MVVTQLPFLVIANADSTLWSEISPAPILSEIPTLMLTKYLPTLNLSLTHFFSFLCILPADIFIFGSIVGASGQVFTLFSFPLTLCKFVFVSTLCALSTSFSLTLLPFTLFFSLISTLFSSILFHLFSLHLFLSTFTFSFLFPMISTFLFLFLYFLFFSTLFLFTSVSTLSLFPSSSTLSLSLFPSVSTLSLSLFPSVSTLSSFVPFSLYSLSLSSFVPL